MVIASLSKVIFFIWDISRTRVSLSIQTKLCLPLAVGVSRENERTRRKSNEPIEAKREEKDGKLTQSLSCFLILHQHSVKHAVLKRHTEGSKSKNIPIHKLQLFSRA